MKPIKKKTAKIFIAFIALMAVIGTLFTFVPVEFDTFRYNAFAWTINQSNELGSGLYAEYDLDGEYTQNQINKSIDAISGVLEEEGFSNSTIYSLNKEKIRIEIGCDINNGELKDSYTLLKAVGIGVFELRSSSSEDDTYIIGSKHIEGVEIQTYNSYVYVMLNFNDKGVEAYKGLLEASDTIYVCMGGETMTSFDSANITASETMPLSFTDYASAEDFAMKVKLGSMAVNLNPDTVRIEITSSILNNIKFTTNPESGSIGFSITKILGIVAIAFVIILGLGFMIFKYGVVGLFQMLAMLFDTIIAIILLWAFPWVEIGLSGLIAIAFGYIMLMSTSVIFASRFEEEYKQGKTVSAAFESAYKKSMNSILAIGIALTVIFGVVAIVASTELKVFGLITCIFSCLSLFSSLVMLPGFMNIFEALNDGNSKPYRLKNKEEK